MTANEDTAARLAALDALVARANEVAQSIRHDLLGPSQESSTALADQTVSPENKGQTSADSQVRFLERRLEERSQEIAMLTTLVKDVEAEAKEATEELEWFRKVLAVTLSQSARRKFAAGSLSRIRSRLAAAGLFDADAYRRRYPDIAKGGMDPLLHYVQHGFPEGRDR